MAPTKHTKLFLFIVFFYFQLPAADARLTQGGGENYGSIAPQVSPHGKSIVYACSKNNAFHIWTMDIDGKNQRELTRLAHSMSPAWSPNGDIIAFNSYGGKGPNEHFSIWMVNVESGKTWEFIKAAGQGDQYPCWSPDGNSIVWTHGHQLWISPTNNPANARPLTRTPAKNTYEFCGDWSPDGKWIAYIASDTSRSSKGIPYKIWMIRPNGQDQSMIFNGISAYRLKWSKRNEWIYFSNDVSLAKVNITSGIQEIVFDWNNANNDFDISPDERWFIYDDEGDDESGNIYRKPFPALK